MESEIFSSWMVRKAIHPDTYIGRFGLLFLPIGRPFLWLASFFYKVCAELEHLVVIFIEKFIYGLRSVIYLQLFVDVVNMPF